ncbi:hypothetical protein JHE06_00925 [Carnobacterium sp. CS13]|uniref:hypothetical protein n=1 Tax=Carnobacterium sp. CS13 TaxID=2800128 RepID=UPI001912606B|nr:hypothetical protein [Carnobacterium sp. CS13]QQP70435.1 hypothetical protein JHE06_00925 [Carnobacterium sp. CS13]
MGIWFVMIGLLGFIFGAGKLLINVVRKKPKKKSAMITLASVVVIIGAAMFVPAEAMLRMEASEVETNAKGVAIIEGTTNSNATVTADGIKIKINDGKFSYKVTLEDHKSDKVTFVAEIEDSQTEKIITVTASEEYVAFLNEQKEEEERMKKVETALALAEDEPTQENYDKAATLVSALTKEYDTIEKRLEDISVYIKAETAVALAEKELSPTTLKDAQNLVKIVNLNKDSFSDRLETIQGKVTEREEQLAVAEEAVITAEENPTDDNYNHAFELIKALPRENDRLTTELASVKGTIDKNKEEAKKVAVAKEKAEAEAKAIAAEKAEEERIASEKAAEVAASASQDNYSHSESYSTHTETTNTTAENPGNETPILITATGSKYHIRKCGNGTYYPATMDEANARGLQPCSKCF